jgi:two-component system, NtrC family, response regulator HydG
MVQRDRDAQDVDSVTVAKDLSRPEPPVGYALVVTAGPDCGQVFAVDGALPARVLVGTSEACTIRLTDREVSRRHAALEYAGRWLRLADLGSTNGTTVEGVTVLDALLRGGETVRMGTTTFRVEPAPYARGASPPGADSFGRFLGASSAVRRLYPLCQRLAGSRIPVVIEGETGTGKEVLAEALHEQGPRAEGAFIVFDCTTVPPNLLEAELFGHERGAFTGAVATRKGLFELAHQGTLLIDEIGDLEVALQAKLLRAIDRSQIRRVGGDRPINVDVRLLAATRRDLDREVQAGRFRDDLYHRLAVGRIELPPLRTRHEDIPLLARHFCRAFGADEGVLSRDLLAQWQEYPWPGNVRELRNAVARRVELGELGEVGRPIEPEPPGAGAPVRGSVEPSRTTDFMAQVMAEDLPLIPARQKVVAEFERRYVERILAKHGGHVGRAAAASGLARRYFQIVRGRGTR